MNLRQIIQAVLAGLMAATAMLGSISGLVAFAAQGAAGTITLPLDGPTLPLGTWAFVACLDGLAIVMALQVHDHERGVDWPALGVLVLVTAASAALQFMAAPANWKAQVVHTAPAPLAGLATAMFFRSLGSRDPQPAKAAKPAAPRRAAAPPPPAPAVPAEEPRDAAVTNIATARRAVEMSDEDIAREAAELLTRDGKTFSRRNWEAACKEVAGVGRVRAGQVRHLAPDLETGT